MAVEPREPPDVDSLRAAGLAAGLDVVGVTSADPFPEVRATLVERKAAGLHAGMSFTYRNPGRSTDPHRSLPDARAIVAGARSYLRAPIPAREEVLPGRIARYAWEDHYGLLRAGLSAVASVLKQAGWRARVLADDNTLVDRAVAHRAGLGWWGKNANLLLPGLGSWYVLGGVVTDAPLVSDATIVEDGCGACTRCLAGCPTGAITAPGVVDARRCLSWLLQAEGVFPLEHRVALGDRIYGCDDCQEVCPPNRRAPIGEGSATEPWVPLLDLLDEDDGVVLARAGRWYIPRRDLRYVRRNALVVLGNIGDGQSQGVVDALRLHLRHPDPLLRAHAVWAARRLGREDLLGPLSNDPDPLVAVELQAVVPPR